MKFRTVFVFFITFADLQSFIMHHNMTSRASFLAHPDRDKRVFMIRHPVSTYFLCITLSVVNTRLQECTRLVSSLVFIFCIVYFTSFFVFSIAVLPHSPGVVYYHLLLRRETRIPGVGPFSIRNLGSFMCIGDRNLIHPQPLGRCGPLQEKDA